MNQALRDLAFKLIEAAKERGNSFNSLVGFDGFIDEIFRVIKRRRSTSEYELFQTIKNSRITSKNIPEGVQTLKSFYRKSSSGATPHSR